MPALTLLYVGQSIDVPAGSMLLSILKIVLLPVLLGVTLNTLFHKRLVPLQPFFPALSSLAIILIIAIIIAAWAMRRTGLTPLRLHHWMLLPHFLLALKIWYR